MYQEQLQADNTPSSGYAFRWPNAGELENKGIEIGLNIKAFDAEDFLGTLELPILKMNLKSQH